jgi:hypothetical protein
VRADVHRAVSQHLRTYSEDVKKSFASITNQILDKLGAQMPDVAIDIPEIADISLDWSQYRTALDYANIPLQEAINFVAFLVNLQGGKARFARGVATVVATVGGRTHVGVITKDRGFRLIDEPELRHRYTGFGDDQ